MLRGTKVGQSITTTNTEGSLPERKAHREPWPTTTTHTKPTHDETTTPKELDACLRAWKRR